MSGGEHLGWRRVAFVRLVQDTSGVRAEVVGQRHRVPCAERVPLRVAAKLVEQGVPVVNVRGRGLRRAVPST